MLKEHCFDRKYVIEPYGTIFATLVTKGLRDINTRNRVLKLVKHANFDPSAMKKSSRM